MVYRLFQKTHFLAARAFLDEGGDMFSHERPCVTSILKLFYCSSNPKMTDVCVMDGGDAVLYLFGQVRDDRGVC